jgi:signal transduction histidine kinase
VTGNLRLLAGEQKRRLAYDLAVALAMTAVSVLMIASLARGSFPRPLVVALPLVILHGLCLVGRRRWPVAVLGVQVITGIAVVAVGAPPVVLGIALLVGIYTVGAYRPLRVSLSALVALEVASASVQWFSQTGPDASTTVGNALVLAAAWFLGYSVHSRRLYVEELERRNQELARARADLEANVVTQERLRIARELHDVIGHSISTIAVQSGVGAHMIDTDPEAAKRSLLTIQSTSRSALEEIRRMLGILRDNGTGPQLDPTPRVEDIAHLVEQANETGLHADLQISGDVSTLPPGMGLAVYRIVQEALTNVLKHSHGGRARVVLTRAPTELRVEVVDNGAGPRGCNDGGHGLIGMRERAELFDGDLETNQLPGGGFRVAARLPLDPSR